MAATPTLPANDGTETTMRDIRHTI
jgi:hypothetical protein